MPGFLSHLFDAGDHAPTASLDSAGLNGGADGAPESGGPADQQGNGDTSHAGGSGESDSDTLAMGGHGGLSAEAGGHLAESGSYDGLDGSEHHWSQADDVDLHVSTDAMLSSVDTLAEGHST